MNVLEGLARLPRRPPRRHRRRGRAEHAASGAAARRLNAGSAALATSVFLDSAAEHFRGGFYNPAMYAAPASSAITLAAAASGRPSVLRRGVFALAGVTGLAGAGFHVYNTARRTGGFRWLNLFYGAPLAAPLSLSAAGLAGLAAQALSNGSPERLLGLPAGPLLTVGAAAGLIGTAAEAGLLHFRGAFQDPFMYAPITVPPLAAAALSLAALRPSKAAVRLARVLAETTVGVGVLGVGFHALGVARNMGGWKNWSQNLQVAPPLPAPPSFTGMALVSLAGLALLDGSR